jgi:hypothetical protein
MITKNKRCHQRRSGKNGEVESRELEAEAKVLTFNAQPVSNLTNLAPRGGRFCLLSRWADQNATVRLRAQADGGRVHFQPSHNKIFTDEEFAWSIVRPRVHSLSNGSPAFGPVKPLYDTALQLHRSRVHSRNRKVATRTNGLIHRFECSAAKASSVKAWLRENSRPSQ